MTVKHWMQDPHCDICPATETIDHIILRCKPADGLWRKLGLTAEANSSQNILQFLEKTLIGDKVFQKNWPICFAACAHTLWIMRNNRVFQQSEGNATLLHHKIQSLINLWIHRAKPKYQDGIRQWSQLLL